ncbi:hypothetical protein WICPIJ_005781 [Wickerhamomyces pijperi]|uniref:Thymidylate kinase n=1 Tax=Wickerhamomyces pijperi TaxID=599730 RepID=A0A9P8TKT1_WICPI|nr:hypothetical protein WICPIJ_005781 [Wickerhamomyces pijperi]
MTKRAPLILIEGLDRTGKTTQTTLLQSSIPSSHLLKFPDRTTEIGKLINEYLTNKQLKMSDQSAHLLFSANRWELAEHIKSLLYKGEVIIMDRYVYSGVAYSAAKEVPGMSLEWCLSCDKGLPKPDLTIFLKLREGGNGQREGFGEERYEVSEFQSRVRQQFEKFENVENKWCSLEVDGLSIEQVQALIWEKVSLLKDQEGKWLTTEEISTF